MSSRGSAQKSIIPNLRSRKVKKLLDSSQILNLMTCLCFSKVRHCIKLVINTDLDIRPNDRKSKWKFRFNILHHFQMMNVRLIYHKICRFLIQILKLQFNSKFGNCDWKYQKPKLKILGNLVWMLRIKLVGSTTVPPRQHEFEWNNKKRKCCESELNFCEYVTLQSTLLKVDNLSQCRDYYFFSLSTFYIRKWKLSYVRCGKFPAKSSIFSAFRNVTKFYVEF